MRQLVVNARIGVLFVAATMLTALFGCAKPAGNPNGPGGHGFTVAASTVPYAPFCSAGQLPVGVYTVYPYPSYGFHGDPSFGVGTLEVGGSFHIELAELPSATLLSLDDFFDSAFVFLDPELAERARLQSIEGFAVYDGTEMVGWIVLWNPEPPPDPGEWPTDLTYTGGGALAYSELPTELRAYRYAGSWEEAETSGDQLHWSLPGGWAYTKVSRTAAGTRFLTGPAPELVWALVHQWCADLPPGYFPAHR